MLWNVFGLSVRGRIEAQNVCDGIFREGWEAGDFKLLKMREGVRDEKAIEKFV